jgi:xylitol oxidase
MQNWAGNLTFSAKEFIEIDSIPKLQTIVEKSNKLKVLGSGHSFSDIADTNGTLISLKKIPPEFEIDPVSKSVSVNAGTSYSVLCKYLESNGWALPNLASLGEITVAGAIMTGTHGSGSRNKVLSDSVIELHMVSAAGDQLIINRQNFEDFSGYIISFGSLGIVTRVKLRIVESFSVKQFVYENVAISSISKNFDEIFNSAYSVSYFGNWAENTTGQIWMKFLDQADLPQLSQDVFGGSLATENQHPVKINDASPCTEQMGVSGKWLYRLPHFKLDSSAASGDEVQTEYLVDRTYVHEYIAGLSAIGNEIAPRVYATEIRSMAADDLWLSGAYARETVGFHFTWRKSEELASFLPKIEEVLGKHQGRPHWGKLFSTSKEQLISRYPKYQEFKNLLRKYDPNGKFSNYFTNKYF